MDKIFRDKLGNATEEYSKDIWSNIEDELFPKKTNSYAGFWLLFFGVLFMTPIVIFKDLDTRVVDEDKESAKLELSKNSNQLSAFEKGLQHLKKENTDKSKLEQQNTTLTQSLQNRENNTQANVSDNLNKINSAASNINNGASNENRTLNTHLSQFSKKSMAVDLRPVQSKILTGDYKPPLTRTTVFKNFEEINKDAIVQNSTYSPKIIRKKSAVDAPKIIGQKSHEYLSIADVPFYTTDHSYLLNFRNAPEWKEPDPCADKPYQLNRWYSEFFVGTGFATKSISAKMAELDYFADLKTESESAAMSFSAGFNVGYQLDNGILFEGGFEYDQFNFSFNYTVNGPPTEVITNVYDSSGINIIGSDTTYESTMETVRSRNVHRMIEVPLLAGMEFYLNKKMSFALKTGISLNLYTQSQGKMVNSSRDIVSYLDEGSNRNEYYKSKFGIAVPVQGQLYFKTTSQIDLFVKGGLKFYPNSITVEDFQLDEKLIFTNLGMGIRIKI